jgi:uncharacterized protein (DUF2384 family)
MRLLFSFLIGLVFANLMGGIVGDTEKFNLWLDSNNLALGGIKPKSLFDSTFGINLLKDELIKIEYGVLA